MVKTLTHFFLDISIIAVVLQKSQNWAAVRLMNWKAVHHLPVASFYQFRENNLRRSKKFFTEWIGHSESFEKNASSLLQGFVWVNSQESSSVEQIVHRVAVKFNSLEQSIAFILRSCHNVPEMRQKIVGAKLGSNPDRLALSATPWCMTLLSG